MKAADQADFLSPAMRQFGESLGELSDSRENIGSPTLGGDVAEFHCADETRHRGGAWTSKGHNCLSRLVLSRVVREAYVAVAEEGAEGWPCLDRVIHGFVDIAILR